MIDSHLSLYLTNNYQKMHGLPMRRWRHWWGAVSYRLRQER